ncbi:MULTISPECIES: serine--tRNA ligase [Synergistaceae]|jgi:seryl-tRNA synthetase|uniref:serine--tRNA ligase n=1 Tax=Synergistaceae TaxID=649777 RepID=UPI003AE0537F|nr:serine--tRNA ligase [Synergistaceae bacterium DZ-S4]
MLDMKWVREHTDEVAAMLANRNYTFPLDKFVELDSLRRDALLEAEALKERRNAGAKEVGMKKKAGENADVLMEEMRLIGEKVRELDEKTAGIQAELDDLAMRLPNRPHSSVPIGTDENDNVEIRKHGKPTEFTFAPKAHWDLGEPLGIMDFEKGVQLAESRFTVLKGAGARLERALMNFMLDLHTTAHGFTEIAPPILVNTATMSGTGQLPKFAEDLYKCANDDLWLIPTAEVPLTNLHAGEILSETDLPKYYCAFTPCFRREAGSYGRDMRGMLRQHQFDKVEMVKLSTPERSYEELEHMTNCAEKVLQLLGIPYRVICLCTGDMGFGAAKTYDIEVWLPSQDCYREISSCSNCEDFQARRMGTKYRPANGGKPRYVHTLNGSGIAIGRCLIALMENFQNEDGSITVPEVLRPYAGGLETVK